MIRRSLRVVVAQMIPDDDDGHVSAGSQYRLLVSDALADCSSDADRFPATAQRENLDVCDSSASRRTPGLGRCEEGFPAKEELVHRRIAGSPWG